MCIELKMIIIIVFFAKTTPLQFPKCQKQPQSVCVFYQEVDMRNPMYMCFDFNSGFHLDGMCEGVILRG